MIELTDKAVKEINRIIGDMQAEGDTEKKYLRIRVVGQGCSGFSFKLDLDQEYREDKDHKFEINGIDVIVDKRSYLYSEDVKIDWHDDMNKRGFEVKSPSARTTCGCGSSFSM